MVRRFDIYVERENFVSYTDDVKKETFQIR